MKEIIERTLPPRYANIIKKMGYKVRLLKYYYNDAKQYSKFAFEIQDKHSYRNLRAKITLHYHSIEKGMSNYNIRLGFGKKALTDLFLSLDNYVELKYSNDDERYLSAISILQSYIAFHKSNNYDVSWVEKRLDKHLIYSGRTTLNNNKNEGGFREYTKQSIVANKDKSFKEFTKSRISTRDYSAEEVNISLVNEAIEIAINTPSVCNRQPWKVYVIRDYQKIQETLNIQRGLNKETRENAKLLLAITTDISYFTHDKERNEPFIDGGLFSMSLLYGLHYKGLAACSLNASMGYKDIDRVKRINRIHESERIIMFITVGNYPDNIKVPVSARDSLEKFVEYR